MNLTHTQFTQMPGAAAVDLILIVLNGPMLTTQSLHQIRVKMSLQICQYTADAIKMKIIEAAVVETAGLDERSLIAAFHLKE